jgi:hypothetical protein
MGAYRPPPAQAQAQPAQAHAQAQAQPPPELRPPEEAEGCGGGLVTSVTPLVNPVTFPTMRLAVDWIPRTIVAAKAAPGNVGRLIDPEGREPVAPVAGARAGRLDAVPVQGR